MKKLLLRTAGLVAGLWAAGTLSAQTVSISTLPPGSVNNVQTQAIAKVVQKATEMQMRVVTFNSPHASMGAVQAGQAAFTFMSNDELGIAVRGKDEHQGKPMDKLRLAAVVFPFKVGILVRKDSNINSVADLKGKRVGVMYGSPPQILLATREGYTWNTFRTHEQMFEALEKGEVDLALMWGPSAGFDNLKLFNSRWQVLPVRGDSLTGQVAVAVSKSKPGLKDQINQALQDLQKKEVDIYQPIL